MLKSAFGILSKTPISYFGLAFFSAWVYVTFYTSALAPFNDFNDGVINLYRECNLLGSSLGFAVLILIERRFGEVSLNPKVQIAASFTMTAGTLLMAVCSMSQSDTIIYLGATSSAVSSLCSSVMYVAWGHFFGLPFNRNSKVILPATQTMTLMIAFLCLFLSGFGLTIFAALLPLISVFFFRKAVAETRVEDESILITREHSWTFPWRIAFVLGVFWFIFAFMNIQTSGGEASSHELLFGTGFAFGIIGSVIVVLQFSRLNSHTTFASVFKISIPLLLLGTILIVLAPGTFDLLAHGICLMAMTILNINILVFGAIFVRKNISSATSMFGGMRVFVNLGEAGALIAFQIVTQNSEVGINPIVSLVLMAIMVCTLLLAMSDTNLDNFHDPRLLIRNENFGKTYKYYDAQEEKVSPMEFYESICFSVARTYELSARETEVLILIGRGRDQPYICKQLFISKPTTNTHIRHIYEKIGIHSKQELIDLLESIGRQPQNWTPLPKNSDHLPKRQSEK